MKQKEWKIIYTKYEGVTKRTISFLSKEAGRMIIREPNVYSIHVLPCEREGCEVSKNAFFVGCYNDSPTIQKFVSHNEVPADGFLVKVVENPDDKDGRFVILTAHTDTELFYAAVSFIDDYITEHAPMHGGVLPMPDLAFDSPLAIGSYAETPDNKTRSIFTWGHSFNDYRAYIDNMARMKFNELIVWNDYLPINIGDIIDYAHSYGIRLLIGYSWGWREISPKADKIPRESLDALRDKIVSHYKNIYEPTGCDGIYFQAFTERKEQVIDGVPIARIVTELINETAKEIFEISPNVRLEWGLHATSVKEWLSEIARLDTRIGILWEDCGEFPYSYNSYINDEESYKETLEFTKKMLELRGGVGVGLVFKGVMMLDWHKFAMQRGPFVMGENHKDIAAHDRYIRANAWREFSANWLKSGDKVAQMIKFIKENKLGDVNMCLAGTFDGGIYLPVALCAQMYRSCDGDFTDILRKVTRRSCITVD